MDLSEGMIRRARQDHPEYPSQVASLTLLPFSVASFDGVFSWYSTIHSPDEDIAGMLAEMRRVLRPGGLVLLGFQTGQACREVGSGYRERGHDVVLMRYSREVLWMRDQLSRTGFCTLAALDRAACGRERDGQGFVLAQAQ